MEIWKDIAGYEGFYQASNLGNIKRINKSQSTSIGKVLKVNRNGSGYGVVSLSKNSKSKTLRVHRLVLQAFGLLVDKLEVNHIDGNKLNNNLLNLECVTRSENIKHMYQKLKVKPNFPKILNKRNELGRFIHA